MDSTSDPEWVKLRSGMCRADWTREQIVKLEGAAGLMPPWGASWSTRLNELLDSHMLNGTMSEFVMMARKACTRQQLRQLQRAVNQSEMRWMFDQEDSFDEETAAEPPEQRVAEPPEEKTTPFSMLSPANQEMIEVTLDHPVIDILRDEDEVFARSLASATTIERHGTILLPIARELFQRGMRRLEEMTWFPSMEERFHGLSMRDDAPAPAQDTPPPPPSWPGLFVPTEPPIPPAVASYRKFPTLPISLRETEFPTLPISGGPFLDAPSRIEEWHRLRTQLTTSVPIASSSTTTSVQPPPVSSSSTTTADLQAEIKDRPLRPGVDDEDAVGCKICFENRANTVLVPCGHQIVCRTCSQPLEDCPLCRTSITQKVYAFLPE